MKDAYVPLHIHTQYSLLDSTIRIPELVEYLKQHNFKSCNISDHGTLGGIIEFYEACKAGGIKPLIGVEAYITNDPDGIEDNSLKTKDNFHLVLIAKDNIGYKILLKLVSEAALHNFYYKPRIYKHKLVECSGHIIATSACLIGETAKVAYLQNDLSVLDYYYEVFGADFYLELQDWQSDAQQLYNQFLLSGPIKQRYNPKYVITSDAHYLTKEDHSLHELMMALQLKKTLKQYREDDVMTYGKEFYVKTPQEMYRSAQELDCVEAYENTISIAEQTDVSITLGTFHMPEFDITKAEDYEDFVAWSKSNETT